MTRLPKNSVVPDFEHNEVMEVCRAVDEQEARDQNKRRPIRRRMTRGDKIDWIFPFYKPWK